MQKFKLPDRRTLVIIGVVLVAALVLLGYLRRGSSTAAGFKTVQVTRGDLQATISATGTVEPEEVVDIGAQVAGRIVSFGKDKNGEEVDYGSVVEAGMVLARIDDALYAADAASAKAQLAQAKAAVLKAKADLGQMQAKLLQTGNDWTRAQKLGPSDALSQTDFDAARAAYEVAKANLAVGKAAIVQAQGSRDPGRSRLEAGPAKPGLLHHQFAGQRGHHRPAGQHRPDRGVQPQCPQPLSPGQGPEASPGLGFGQ